MKLYALRFDASLPTVWALVSFLRARREVI